MSTELSMQVFGPVLLSLSRQPQAVKHLRKASNMKAGAKEMEGGKGI